MCYILICCFLLSLFLDSSHRTCLFKKKKKYLTKKQTRKSCPYCPLQSAKEAQIRKHEKNFKIHTIQLALIFHPSIIHLSDCRVTHSNCKQKNLHYVLLLIFSLSELGSSHHPPGDSHLCHDLGHV